MKDIRSTLTAAPPSLLVEQLAARLRAELGITEVELLLVDYRLATLIPLLTRDTVPAPDDPRAPQPPPRLPGDAAWRCFDRQLPLTDNGVLYLPVTARSERLGVLRLAPVRPADVDELAELGGLLGHEVAAGRASTDRYLIGARARRLTLAAEMQWAMLPGRSCVTDQFSLAGQLEPAYAVRGDTFDWSSNVDTLSLSMVDGMGEGVAAAALSTLATNALRNARRGGLSVGDQAALADAAIYGHHQGGQYVAALLLEIDLPTGRLTAVDTGSPIVLLARGDAITRLTFAAHDPLGMFDGSHFAEQTFQLLPGDRLVIVSDGIHAATAGARRYGEESLVRLVQRTRGLSPLDVVRTQMSELSAFVAGPLADDAAIVCVDWTGGPVVQ